MSNASSRCHQKARPYEIYMYIYRERERESESEIERLREGEREQTCSSVKKPQTLENKINFKLSPCINQVT